MNVAPPSVLTHSRPHVLSVAFFSSSLRQVMPANTCMYEADRHTVAVHLQYKSCTCLRCWQSPNNNNSAPQPKSYTCTPSDTHAHALHKHTHTNTHHHTHLLAKGHILVHIRKCEAPSCTAPSSKRVHAATTSTATARHQHLQRLRLSVWPAVNAAWCCVIECGWGCAAVQKGASRVKSGEGGVADRLPGQACC